MNIEKRYKVVFGEAASFRILLVGVGGTGSSLALALGGLMFHARQKGIRIELTLVDDDKIEEKNVGRQAFGVAGAAMGGVYKCAALALRLNAAYGLDIAAWPERYEAGMGCGWATYDRSTLHLVIGCVDNHFGRQEIAKTIEIMGERLDGRLWALDSGNAEFNGQLLIGNTTNGGRIRLDKLGLCAAVPSPYLQEPGLLRPEENQQPLSCADLTLRDEQSLTVNRMAATIAAQYVYNMSVRRQLTQMGTAFNLEPTVMTPKFITQENIEACFETKAEQRDSV